MNFKKPHFWNLKKPNLYSYLLTPFTIPIIINNFLSKIKKKNKFSKIKSICVGNIYLGGTGKTPLTIKLFKIIKEMGLKVVTAKKFYSGQSDEQTLLKEKTETIITNNRYDAINKAINNLDEVIIFDDGLQEKKIDYDMKIVCFKKKNWIGNGQLIPAGPLREKIENLKNYDVVFLNGKNESSGFIKEMILNINSQIKIFDTYYEPKNFNNVNKNSNYLIFSGIGDPFSFKEILVENDINIVKEKIFPDHYFYKKKDMMNILSEAQKLNAKILTTEKDFVKLPENFKKKINFLEIELIITEEQRLKHFLNDKFN